MRHWWPPSAGAPERLRLATDFSCSCRNFTNFLEELRKLSHPTSTPCTSYTPSRPRIFFHYEVDRVGQTWFQNQQPNHLITESLILPGLPAQVVSTDQHENPSRDHRPLSTERKKKLERQRAPATRKGNRLCILHNRTTFAPTSRSATPVRAASLRVGFFP